MNEISDTPPKAAAPALLDGRSYLESLRDARSVYIDGERVADVTRHPAFRNSARSIARLYDALHDPSLDSNTEQVRLDIVRFAERRGLMDEFIAFADQCMADYDLAGWTNDTWT